MSVPKLPTVLEELFLGEYTPELEQRILAYLNSPELQIETNELAYTLLAEPEGWTIFLDFGTKKKVKELIEEAEELAPSMEMLGPIDGSVLESMKSNLLAAEEKYKEALSLSDNFRAKNNLEYLRKQINKLNIYEKYKGVIHIKNIDVGEAQGGETGIFGEVKNTSNKTFIEVGITVFFLDKKGNPIHEKSYHPVYVTERSYGDDAIPLKPNYSRKFGVNADDAPYEWSKKVKVIISDLEIKPD